MLTQDENGNPLAIYDLSKPNPLHWRQTQRMLLGTIGVGDFDLGDVIRLIKKGWINRKGIEEKEEKKLRKALKKLGKLEKILTL